MIVETEMSSAAGERLQAP